MQALVAIIQLSTTSVLEYCQSDKVHKATLHVFTLTTVQLLKSIRQVQVRFHFICNTPLTQPYKD